MGHVRRELAFPVGLGLKAFDQPVDRRHHAREFSEPMRVVEPLAALQVEPRNAGRQGIERPQPAAQSPPHQQGHQRQNHQGRTREARAALKQAGPTLLIDRLLASLPGFLVRSLFGVRRLLRR